MTEYPQEAVHTPPKTLPITTWAVPGESFFDTDLRHAIRVGRMRAAGFGIVAGSREYSRERVNQQLGREGLLVITDQCTDCPDV